MGVLYDDYFERARFCPVHLSDHEGKRGEFFHYRCTTSSQTFEVLPESCSDLTVTGDGTPGSTLTFDVVGADPHALAFLAVGRSAGSHAVALGPLGTLELGLDPHFIVLPFGFTDAGGDASKSIGIPDGFPISLDLFGQAFTARFTLPWPAPPTLEFCTTDVEAFHVGN